MRSLLTCLLFILNIVPGVQEEGHVQKTSAGVNFTHHSQVEQASDNSYKITNFIRNDSDRPLSVKWELAGILCTGDLQLPPGQMDYGASGGLTYRPLLVDNSEIKYGLSLQYLANARIYVDAQSKKASEKRTSLYERRNKDGGSLFRVEVISTSNDKGASIIIRVQGGLSLIAASEIKDKIEKTGSILTYEKWKIAGIISFDEIGLKEEQTLELAAEWLDRPLDMWPDRKSTRLNSSHLNESRMPSSA